MSREEEALQLLEELLSLSEWQQVVPTKDWQRISASTADLRDGENV